ncbi:MAG: hypothetical protein JW723_04325 [Bacteroidales bacterium]|nr:hypothetical protein [Bacteroidales bacterium]
MRKKIIPTLLIALLHITMVFNQEESSPLAIAWYPQLMAIRGLRADIDVHLGKSKSWLIFAPQYYLAKRHAGIHYDDYDDYSSSIAYKRLEGYGLELQHRVYIANNYTPDGIYLAYGLQYGHFDITYEDYSWGEIDYMDLEAYTYGLFEHNTVIDKMGPNIIIGYQKQVLDRIFVDFFCGGGIRYSFINTSSLFPRNFDGDPFQFGYTGTVPLAGFRIGIAL